MTKVHAARSAKTLGSEDNRVAGAIDEISSSAS